MGGKKYSLRGRIEIMADILRISKQGRKKTHIMMRANVSYSQLGSYLRELQEKGLIEKKVIDRSTLYIATERGRDYLETYDGIKQMLDSRKLSPMYEEYSTV